MQRSVAAVTLPNLTCDKCFLMQGGARASKTKNSIFDPTSYHTGWATVVDVQAVSAEVNLENGNTKSN